MTLSIVITMIWFYHYNNFFIVNVLVLFFFFFFFFARIGTLLLDFLFLAWIEKLGFPKKMLSKGFFMVWFTSEHLVELHFFLSSYADSIQCAETC
jgi:hypothetical protein